MSLLQFSRCPLSWRIITHTRRYARGVPESPGTTSTATAPKSSCVPDTVLTGVNYLKGQPAVLALPDEEYPDWLWTLLDKKVIPEDGPGGLAEKARMKKERIRAIKDRNFMSTQ